MSVDRNYTNQISRSAPPSGQLKRIEASSEGIDDKTPDGPKRESSEILERTDTIEPEAVLNSETEGAPPEIGNSGAVASTTHSSQFEDKTGSRFSRDITAVVKYSGDFQDMNSGISGSHADSRAGDGAPQNRSEVNTNEQSDLVNQIRQLQASFHTQAPTITRQDMIDMLSAVRQLKEMFLERQRKSVTRQELKSELQALRLVMEGRK